MNRRNSNSIVANPILVGGVTVLVVIVAVFLSYNANNGLPFIPSYILHVEVPNGAGLVKNNEVRRGGARIGVVSDIGTRIRRDGRAIAVITLKLDKHYSQVPRDSSITIRTKSALGLKYIQLNPGHSRSTFRSGQTMALVKGAKRPVEIDDFFAIFDAPTRAASQRNLIEFGNGFAGRGGDLNKGLRGFKPLAVHGERALRNIVAPRTAFDRFFPALEQAAAEAAPVGQEQGQLFAGLNQTFSGLAGVSDQLRATIAGGPHALDVATRELPAQAKFTVDSTELFHRLRPAFGAYAHASPGLARAFTSGTPALKRSPALNARLQTTLQHIQTFAADSRVVPALTRLTETANLLNPVIAFATPAQTTCNYFGLFFHNLASALSESDQIGSFLRFAVTVPPQLPGSEAGPAAVPANGPANTLDGAKIGDNFLHSNPYPNTDAPGQTPECEAGNEEYIENKTVIGNVPGNQGTASEKTHDWKAER